MCIHPSQRPARCITLCALAAMSLSVRPTAAACPELLIPAYQYPTLGTMWQQLSQAVPTGLVINVIFNPASGPGSIVDPVYTQVLADAQAAGCRILVYVDTSYTARPVGDVVNDVLAYRAMYPGFVGVFLDQMSNTQDRLAYYQSVTQMIHQIDPALKVFGNPGTPVPESYLSQNAADVIVTYENDALSPIALYQELSVPAWVNAYPASRFAHIVYNVQNATDMRRGFALADQRRVGYLYFTDDVLVPSPYDTLPVYWDQHRRGCRADINCAGGVSVQDIFDFLAIWFAGDPRADFNATGGISVQDIFDFLASWFQGC